MSEETAVVPESPPEEAPVEETQESVTPESLPEETSVTEESQPPKDEEGSESSPETELEAIKKALAENAEDSPKPEKPVEEAPPEEVKPEPKVQEESDQSDLYKEPEGLKPKAQERFQALVENNKSVTQELDQARTAMTEIQETVKNSGMSPEEFGQMLSYAQMANSRNKDDNEYAFKMIKAEYQRMASKIGQEVEGVDLFEEFPDIKSKVDGYELSKEDAMEIINARRQLQGQAKTKEQEKSKDSEAEAKTAAIEGVTNFMDSMAKTDIDFDAKEKILLEQVEEIQKNYPVHKWPVIVKQLYNNIGRLSSQTKQAKKVGDNAPLKSTTNLGGATAPQTAVDAVKLALSQR